MVRYVARARRISIPFGSPCFSQGPATHGLIGLFVAIGVAKEKIDEKFLDINEIQKRIKNGSDILGRDENFLPIKIDDEFPDYILEKKKSLNVGIN